MTPSDSWMDRAVTAVEQCVEDLIEDFLARPFSHRVEHSLHVDLYQLLRQRPIFSGDVAIGDSGYTTRLVHKEWPTHRAEAIRGTRERRQSYDIAILNPEEVKTGSLKDLVEGRFRAPIAIELGLDYNSAHIVGDRKKLTNNEVQHGYVVHLTRKPTRNAQQVDDQVLTLGPIRTAFAHLDTRSGTFRYKGLNDREIRDRPFRP